ncbi:hypothetical protein [Nocardia sp. NPDC050793]|uniref:hypothetical protein n=1 Tax=Nocardia sp. NPDC050793 TaxID=3155159 RepID=UPI0033DEEB01
MDHSTTSQATEGANHFLVTCGLGGDGVTNPSVSRPLTCVSTPSPQNGYFRS